MFYIFVLLICICEICNAGHYVVELGRNHEYFNDSELTQFGHIKSLMDKTFAPENPHMPVAMLISEIREFKSKRDEHVLGFLGECFCSKLDRPKFPERRGVFDLAIVSQVRKTFEKRDHVLTVTVLGAGRLFEALVIVTKLIDCGFLNIQVNLIDDLYKPYFVDMPVTNEYYLRSDELNKMFFQFLCWFSYLKEYNVSNLKIKCDFYDDINEYALQINHGEIAQSDLLIASDFTQKPLETFLAFQHNRLLKKGGVYGYLIEGEFYEFNKQLFAPILQIPTKFSERTGCKLHDPLFAYVGVKY
jgi:hypothetical protein